LSGRLELFPFGCFAALLFFAMMIDTAVTLGESAGF